MPVLDLVGIPEIAEMLGVARRSAWRYVRRPGFPEPVARVQSKSLWDRVSVQRWAQTALPIPRGRPKAHDSSSERGA
jgi:predicted DNA-binding transcriptional regulator AlpA